VNQRTDGRQARWQRHQEQRRQHIIDAALLELESAEPGAEIKVAQIAERAGVNRSVLYRYFADRSDLELAIQREICERLGGAVVAEIGLDGTPREILGRTIATFVQWVSDHPACMRFVDKPVAGSATSPLEEWIGQIAELAETVIVSIIALVGGELTDADRALLDPWVFGIVGGCHQVVRRWTSMPEQPADAHELITFLTETTWAQLTAVATSRGIAIPDVPVETLMGSSASTTPL